MVVNQLLIPFCISYLANILPNISNCFKNDEDVERKLNLCFNKALDSFSENETIKDKFKKKFSSLSDLKKYLNNEPNLGSDEKMLMAVFIDQLGKDFHGIQILDHLEIFDISNRLDNYFQTLMQELSELGNFRGEKVMNSFKDVSSSLRNINADVGNHHIDRIELNELYQWVKSETGCDSEYGNITLLLGNAGTGKSVVLRDLLKKLESEDICVLGLKLDLLVNSDLKSFDEKVGLGIPVVQAIKRSAQEKLTVLLVDQLDVLSSALSSNRQPLSEINTIVKELAGSYNVKVIVSCRNYDIVYDSSLDFYRKCRQITIDKFAKADVARVLKEENVSIQDVEDDVYELIQNPLNLFLFLRTDKNTNNIVSKRSLYDQIWKECVIDVSCNGISTCRLIDYLWMFSCMLNNMQVLSVDKNSLGSEWAKEQNYLISNGILALDELTENIHFIHQLLFDYVYARLFYEKKRTIQSEFLNVHQGLFIRPRLKQILQYQRSVDNSSFLKNVKHILFEKEKNGDYLYRYHIRHLVVSFFATETSLIEEEIFFVESLIKKENEYSGVYLSFANTIDAFNIVKNIIDEEGGFEYAKEELKNGIFLISEKILYAHPKDLVVFFLSIYSKDLEIDFQKRIVSVLNSISGQEIFEDFISLADRIEIDEGDVRLVEYYENLCTYKPEKVVQRLMGIIDTRIVLHKDSYHNFVLPINADIIYSHLKERSLSSFFELNIRILEKITSVYVRQISDDPIRCVSPFLLYCQGDHNVNFSARVLDEILSYVEKQSEDNDIKNNLLEEYIKSDVDVYHIVAIGIILSDVDNYKGKAFQYLLDNINKECISSVLLYYRKLLFQKTFSLFTNEEQNRLIGMIDILYPKSERDVYKYRIGKDIPVLRIGRAKAQYLSLIPERYLSENYPKQMDFLRQMKRKFGDFSLEKPNKVETLMGWTTMQPSAYENMDVSGILCSMEKINSDDISNWKAPSLTGHSYALRSYAEKEPKKYFDIYKKACENPNISVFYIVEGVRGLLNGDFDPIKIEELLSMLIDRVSKGEDDKYIMNISRFVNDYYEKGITPPNSLCEYVCKKARTVKDDYLGSEIIDINTAINKKRGCVCESLVQLGTWDVYYDKVIKVIDEISETADVAARCAMLFQLGLLLKENDNRILNIFLKLTADYNENLLRMPLHRYNPIIYFVRDKFDTLIPYFKACLNVESSYVVNISLLLRAHLLGNNKAETMMFKMADQSVEARCQLIKDVKFYLNEKYSDKCIEILYHYIDIDEKDLGSCYDDIFTVIGKISKKKQYDYVELFVYSSMAKYCDRYIYDFLFEYTKLDPLKCLDWLNILFDQKKNQDYLLLNFDKIVNVLIQAYFSIRKFGKDVELERSMDLLDLILNNVDNSHRIVQCLNEMVN